MANRFYYPRPEYPRPDRQRGTMEGYNWQNLNGPWQFRFDPERKGEAEKWFAPDQPEWREQIIVPFCWESLAAWGEGDNAGNDNYYSTRVFINPLEVTRENHRSAPRFEVGWYRRYIEVPDNDAWRDKRVILTIGAADFFTDCWCNGTHFGHHEGGYTPFEFDITDVLTISNGSRQGVIVLRVEDPMDNSEQPVGKQWRWYTTTSGIWQTVFLEPRNLSHIKCFRISTSIPDSSVHVAVDCLSTGDDSDVLLELEAPGGTKQSATLPVRSNKAEATIKLNPLILWDPNRPELYHATLTLRGNGQTLDQVLTYFGVRKIDFQLAKESGVPAALRVNGAARYLRGALYQSYHPDGVYTAGSVQTLKDDITYAKKVGFNFLRVHIKVDDPLLLYWADKLGMLLMADFPNFGEGGDTPRGRQRFETMMREAIERDFNHPSIFAWCCFNETWGFGGQTSFSDKLLPPPNSSRRQAPQTETPASAPIQRTPARGMLPGMSPPQAWVQEMWELAKELDPTRLVEDMSVCHWEHLEYYQHCDTDINSWHFYINDYAKAKEHIARIVKSTYIGSSFNYVPGFLHKGQPLINSEYGGIGALDGDRDISWSFKFLTNELRRYQQISAYIYTELHDVEWEYNGFLNYDRTPKQFGYDPRMINESNALPVDAPPVQRVKPGDLVRVEVSSSHFSTDPCRNVTLHWELAGMDTHGRLRQDLARGRKPIPFPHLRVAPAHVVELRMPDQTMLCTLLLSARDADGITIAANFAQFFVSDGYPGEREESPRRLALRQQPANWSQAEWSGEMSDRDKARAEDCCWGIRHGSFEWAFPLDGVDLSKAFRIQVLCEASSHRFDWPQTDDDILSTTMLMTLNDMPIYRAVLRNHPHDARGVLSYWRGGLGGYGYLAHAMAEGVVLREIAERVQDGRLRLRCTVPADALPLGGLTIYGAECGRFPLGPTILIDW